MARAHNAGVSADVTPAQPRNAVELRRAQPHDRLGRAAAVEAEERAHEFALEKAEPEAALLFFLDWPRLDLAAKLIKAHPHRWDGRDWQILLKVAKLIEHEQPLAATILYRALLDDILDRARSKAYSHGIKYLKKLTLLSAEADTSHGGGIVDHATYLAHLKKNHPRKTGFWTRLTESG